MGTGLTKGHATWSSIPLKRQFSNLLEDLGGNPQSFVYGPDILAAWIDQPAKYMALKKLIHFLRQMYNCNQLQFGFNSEKLGGLKRDDFLQLLNKFTADNRLVRTDFAPGQANQVQQSGIVIDDSDNISGVNNLDAATIHVTDKATFDAEIDPTAVRYVEQASVPTPGAAGEGSTWVRDDNPTRLIYTDSDDVDHNLLNVQQAFYRNWGNAALIETEFLNRPLNAPFVSGDVHLVPGGGGGAGFSAVSGLDLTGHPGVWGLTTGTTAAGRIFVLSALSGGFHIGVGGITQTGSIVNIGSVVSNALQEFVVRSGIFSISLPNTILSGVGFEYQFNQNGGRWQGVTATGVGESSVDLGITVVASAWYKLEAVINAAGTSVDFFIDGIFRGNLAVAANIPQGITFDQFYNMHIMKLVGTTARVAYIDAMNHYQEFVR